jgi:hypothetical protein
VTGTQLLTILIFLCKADEKLELVVSEGAVEAVVPLLSLSSDSTSTNSPIKREFKGEVDAGRSLSPHPAGYACDVALVAIVIT